MRQLQSRYAPQCSRPVVRSGLKSRQPLSRLSRADTMMGLLVRDACPRRLSSLSDSRPPTTQRQAWRPPGTLRSVARGSYAPLQPSSCRLTRSSPKCPESERRIGYRFDPRHPESRRCHLRRPRSPSCATCDQSTHQTAPRICNRRKQCRKRFKQERRGARRRRRRE